MIQKEESIFIQDDNHKTLKDVEYSKINTLFISSEKVSNTEATIYSNLKNLE